MFFDTVNLLRANVKKSLREFDSNYFAQASFTLLLLAEIVHTTLIVSDHGEVNGATETLNTFCDHYSPGDFQVVIDAGEAPKGVAWLVRYGFDVSDIIKDPMVTAMAAFLVRHCSTMINDQASGVEFPHRDYCPATDNDQANRVELSYTNFGVPSEEGDAVAEKLATALWVFGPDCSACGP